jgi:hypothetical protein
MPDIDLELTKKFTENITIIFLDRMIAWNVFELNKAYKPIYEFIGLSSIQYYEFSLNPHKWVEENIVKKIDASTAVIMGLL